MLRRTLFIVTLLVMCLGVVWTTAFAEEPKYDPRVHVYREGLGQSGLMGRNVRYGTLESLIPPEHLADQNVRSALAQAKSRNLRIPLFDTKGGTIKPLAVEYGSWFYPRAWPWDFGDAFLAWNVRWNSCGGGDDAWVDYYYINENEFFANRFRVWATNPVSSAHIALHSGLDGGYYCVGRFCTLSVCSTQEYGANPWSVYLLRLR